MPYSRSKKSSAAPFEFFAMNSVRHWGYRHLPTCTSLHSEPGLQGGTALCNYKYRHLGTVALIVGINLIDDIVEEVVRKHHRSCELVGYSKLWMPSTPRDT